jgi:uncharacterized protein YutE (UPF0331/DUF86 family)
MYDKERITKIIRDIEKYFSDLEELDVQSIEDLKDIRNYHALSMILFTLINRAIDLGNEIMVANKYGMAVTYAEIFTTLYTKKTIPEKTEKDLLYLVRSRNRLSHQYQDLGDKEVYEVYKRIHAIEDLVKITRKIVGNGKGG